MSTPCGNSDPYCSVAGFLQRHDYRTVGDFLANEGQRPTLQDVLTVGHWAYNTLFTLLQEGAGEIEAACLRGNRYTAADLLLVGGTPGNSQQLLVGLNADVVVPKLFDRRPDLNMPLPRRVEHSLDVLAALEAGEAVFALQEVTDAGLPSHQIESPRVAWERALPSTEISRYFGRRSNQRIQRPAS